MLWPVAAEQNIGQVKRLWRSRYLVEPSPGNYANTTHCLLYNVDSRSRLQYLVPQKVTRERNDHQYAWCPSPGVRVS
jgi:hypothetical protein